MRLRRRLGALLCFFGKHKPVDGTWTVYCERCETILREKVDLSFFAPTEKGRLWRRN